MMQQSSEVVTLVGHFARVRQSTTERLVGQMDGEECLPTDAHKRSRRNATQKRSLGNNQAAGQCLPEQTRADDECGQRGLLEQQHSAMSACSQEAWPQHWRSAAPAGCWRR